MASPRSLVRWIVVGAVMVGCGGTPQPEISYPAFASALLPAEIVVDGWTITLEEATVAFGPVYFCAAESGSATLCETAVGEIARVVAIDALAGQSVALGNVVGIAGTVRSASYDYGIHWFATEPSPVAAPEAPGGHSARFVGRAVRGGDEIRIEADVDVLAQHQGQRAVPSVEARASIDGDADVRLDVQLDPAAWLAAVDYDDLFALPENERRIALGTKAHDAISISMVAGSPARFVWTKSR